MSEGRPGFATTRWSVIAQAARPGGGPLDTTQREAMETLVQTYWYPLYAFARSRSESADATVDALQAYFARLIEKGALAKLQPENGRFRAFLFTSLKYFLANEREHRNALKRGGGVKIVPLDTDDAERRYAMEPADEATPEREFDRRFAVALLERTLARLREEQSSARQDMFKRLEPLLGGSKEPRDEIAEELGMTTGAIRVALHRLRRRYAELLREEVMATVTSESEVEDELGRLFDALVT